MNNTNRWRQLHSLFDTTCNLPPEQWRGTLERLTNDTVLVEQTLELLQFQTHDPKRAPTDAPPPQPFDEGQAADRLGPWRLVERLGSGGMGVVYAAERADGLYEQKVAVKLLRGMSDPDNAARLAEERRILAGLQHPNIARLYDGGTTASGMPYLVMEFIDGTPLDAYCSQHAPNLQQRLALFLRICRAVQAAHEHLVVHCDLKPGNVLVRADGEPMLLDFGLSRPLSGVAQEAALNFCTPAYAAPEMLAGQAISTRSDVFSLGVMLVELLACGPAKRTANDRNQPVPAPSALAGDACPWRNRLRGDLDAIAAQACALPPDARYATVNALADDVQRYLEHRPVKARAGELGYRVQRWAYQQRWAIAAGVAILAVAAGFIVQRGQQLAQVTAERNKAQAVSGFMRDLFAHAKPEAEQDGGKITVQEVLDHGAAELEQRKNLDAATRTTLRLSIADAYDALDLNDRALPLYQTSLAELEQRGGNEVQRAQILGGIARAYSAANNNAQAIQADRNGMALVADIDDPDAFLTWARLRDHELDNRALMVNEPAENLVKDMQELLNKLEARAQANADPRLGQLSASVWDSLAGNYKFLNRTDESIQASAKAVELATQWNVPPATRLSYVWRHATSYLDKDPDQALKLMLAADEEYARLIGPATVIRARHLMDIAGAYSYSERYEESADYARRAVDMARSVLGTDNRIFLKMAIDTAIILLGTGHASEGLALVDEALPGLRKLQAPGMDTVNVAYALKTRADIHLKNGGDAKPALADLEEANALMAPYAGKVLSVEDDLVYSLVRAHMALHQPVQARAALRDYIALLDRENIPADSRWRKTVEQMRAMIDP